MISSLEKQLWLWLEDCERGKPRALDHTRTEAPDQVVPFLQDEVREGREASEA